MIHVIPTIQVKNHIDGLVRVCGTYSALIIEILSKRSCDHKNERNLPPCPVWCKERNEPDTMDGGILGVVVDQIAPGRHSVLSFWNMRMRHYRSVR